MSNKRITDLTELTNPTTDDVFPVVDIATNTTTKVQLGNLPVPSSVTTALATKQDSLVSGTNIKTINSTSVLGSGDIAVQETLVSGTNIKTLNNTSLLGSGNITLTANPSGVAGAIQFSNGSAFASDASNLFWDDTNNRLGVGTNTPTATTHIKGSGSTSATTALLVQNSAGVASLQVLDDTSVFNNGKGAVASNTAFGNSALIANTTGSGNTAYGVNALAANTTGSDNTANGGNSLALNTSGSNNTAIGVQALFANSGANNTAIGRGSLRNNTASNNTAVGYEAGFTNTSGTGITAIGYHALRASTGGENTAVGYQAGLGITTGTQTTALGYQALAGVAGSRNTAVGYAALTSTTGAFNTAVGRQALSNNTTGGSNTAIGENCQSGNFSGSVILGKDAIATAANQFVVGSTGTNAGSVVTESNSSTKVWNVIINGVAQKILLA